MKLSPILHFAALSAALVIPDEEVLSEIATESRKIGSSIYKEIESSFSDAVESSKNALDTALASLSHTTSSFNDKVHDTAYDVDAWFNSHLPFEDFGGGEHPPHHGPPHDGPPHHGPPHHGPHHPPHHGKPNMTVYQLIAESKYTTKLAKLINDDEDLVRLLNGTTANFTVFAPTDHAFEKIPEHAPKPSKEMIRKLLSYHISPDFYPARRVLKTHTIPTILGEPSLGKKPMPQRLAVKLTLRGLTLNYYARVVAVDIFGTNGVIHGLDDIIIPPPKTLEIIDLFPTEFSTLELGLGKTGLLDTLNTTAHAGGTFFAPSNFAFRKLGPKINAFLFSKYGLKYLKGLLEYHVVVNQTLYSDAFYKGTGEESMDHHDGNGYFHVDLPTLLDDRSLSVDVARYGPFISIKVNGFSRVTVQDGVAKDGVIQVVSDVLIPPKKLGGAQVEYWTGEEMSVEEFMERLEPFVQDDRMDL
ncbi:hypothetical protein H2201_005762 [Coniosporium apollinis]|uniref:FAS1 domain-containing protein n=2 Tax=Coniosporium TaxID=2810619 RepID=A0ABQ9NVD6_9PEZI|nr:hypothetical protein H2199_008415 [Cladosporium sp. JES 115]KAJ9663091.1 hypothetical protein H2201_005762 [Coniosporium apollinis]